MFVDHVLRAILYARIVIVNLLFTALGLSEEIAAVAFTGDEDIELKIYTADRTLLSNLIREKIRKHEFTCLKYITDSVFYVNHEDIHFYFMIRNITEKTMDASYVRKTYETLARAGVDLKTYVSHVNVDNHAGVYRVFIYTYDLYYIERKISAYCKDSARQSDDFYLEYEFNNNGVWYDVFLEAKA